MDLCHLIINIVQAVYHLAQQQRGGQFENGVIHVFGIGAVFVPVEVFDEGEHPSWEYAANWDMAGVAAMIFIIIFGTMTPYLLFLNGVKYIGPTKSSLYASAEPLASTIVSVVWLKVGLELMDYIGFIFIVAAVLMLSFVKPKEKTENVQ